MRGLLAEWCRINSGTFHSAGLARQCDALDREFRDLGDQISRRPSLPLQSIDSRGELVRAPLGDSLLIRCRISAPVRVLLSIHMDTVYPADSPFQDVQELDAETWIGPGVADAKGGLVVLLFALRAFERFARTTGNQRVGWDVILNADEEIGSPGSRSLFDEIAPQVSFGLLYEPALPNGHMVSSRKGSGNFAFVVRGKAAHAGRDFAEGRNAITVAAAIASQLHALNGRWPDVTINVARIDGGGPLNMVPDLGIVRCNIRYRQPELSAEILAALDVVAEKCWNEGITIQRQGDFTSPPKLLDHPTTHLLEQVRQCGQELGINLSWQPSGGTCDGNRLAALGVPNVDSLGVRGGNLHSPQEFIQLDSLVERAQLTALLLMRLATGEIPGLSGPGVDA